MAGGCRAREQGMVLIQECTPALRPFAGGAEPLFESAPAGFRVYEDPPEIEPETAGTARRLLRMGQGFQLLGYPHGLDAPSLEGWVLLFQEHNPDESQDGGLDIFYFIRPDALAALRFSSVQCESDTPSDRCGLPILMLRSQMPAELAPAESASATVVSPQS